MHQFKPSALCPFGSNYTTYLSVFFFFLYSMEEGGWFHHPSHLHYSRMRIWHCFPIFWVIICPHFWTLYSFHFPLCFSHSKSFIYVNTCIINQQFLNKTKSMQFQSLPVDTNPQIIINKSNKTHRQIRKKSNETPKNHKLIKQNQQKNHKQIKWNPQRHK